MTVSLKHDIIHSRKQMFQINYRSETFFTIVISESMHTILLKILKIHLKEWNCVEYTSYLKY